MPKIFINYRRGGTAGHAGRLFDRMQQDFGAANVFMDVSAIKPGSDFAREIENAVGACDVLLVVIGRDWVSCVDGHGKRRLLASNDFVRREVSAAIGRRVAVVPVLVQRADLPEDHELPDDLKPLVRRQAFELRDARWDADVTSLSEALQIITAPKRAPSALAKWQRPALAALATLLLSGVALAWFAFTDARSLAIVDVDETRRAAKSANLDSVPKPPPPPSSEVAPHRVAPSAAHAGAVVAPPPSEPRHERASRSASGSSAMKAAGVIGGVRAETKKESAALPVSQDEPAALPVPSAPAQAPTQVVNSAPAAVASAIPAFMGGGGARPVVNSAPCGPVPPWTPMAAPRRGLINKVFRSDDSFDARVALLRDGPPCRTAAAAKRALSQRRLSSQQYDDILWVLQRLRNTKISAEKSNLAAGLISRPEYDARTATFEAEYQGI